MGIKPDMMQVPQLKAYVESSESNVLLVVEFPKDQLVIVNT